MDTVIKLRPEELTEEFFKKLQQFAANANRVEIRLDGIDAVNNLSDSEIENRLQGLAGNKTVSFTMEELEAYIHKIAG